MVCCWWAETNYVQAVSLCNKFEVSTLTHYEDIKGDKNAKKLGGLGLGHHQHSHSTECIRLPI